jgi:hypothetical protein
MHYAFQVPLEQNINSLLLKDIQFFLQERAANWNLRVRGEHVLLRGNLSSWHGIAREDWLGILMLLLDVRDMLGYMEFVSMLVER